MCVKIFNLLNTLGCAKITLRSNQATISLSSNNHFSVNSVRLFTVCTVCTVYNCTTESQDIPGEHGCVTSLRYFCLPAVSPISEGEVVFGAGEEQHVGEGGDHGEKVEDGEREQHRVEECVDLCTARTRIDQLSVLPETGLTETETGERWPAWRRRRLGAVRGVESDQVQQVGDGADQGEEGGDEGDEETEENTGCLDRKDACMMFRAWVVIPTATDKYQPSPPGQEDQDATVQGPVTTAVDVVLDRQLPDS